MPDENEVAASAATDEVKSEGAVGNDGPGPGPSGVGGDVTEEELVDLRESALADADQANKQQIVITLGETVYYGDGSGQVWPAIIVHVYGTPAANDEDRNDTYVDLQVFKRKAICDVERVAQHSMSNGGALNGWVFKA